MLNIFQTLIVAATKIKIDPPPVGSPSLNTGFGRVFFWAGIIAVVVLVFAGYKYIASAGNPEQAKQARNTIFYTVIGLIVIMLSFAIVNIVLGALK